jgi:hypothetical protein
MVSGHFAGVFHFFDLIIIVSKSRIKKEGDVLRIAYGELEIYKSDFFAGGLFERNPRLISFATKIQKSYSFL